MDFKVHPPDLEIRGMYRFYSNPFTHLKNLYGM